MKKIPRIIINIGLILVLMSQIASWLLFSSFLVESSFAGPYTESSANTFDQYKKQLTGIKEDIEAEFRKNGNISSSTLQNAKNIVQSAYDRLPDSPDFATENATAKKWTDLTLDLAMKNSSSQTYVSNAASAIERFANEAKILKMGGSITADPVAGNAPLSVSFQAVNVIDPSGVTPTPNSYIWWIRENGGYRREIGRGPTLNYSFPGEGSYQVFLDVISGSRNSRWYTDVLPLSTSQSIQVNPRLWEIILLVNGVNVSTLQTLKVSPSIGKMGIILDASASRAISNGTIKGTKWDFWNGNTLEYKGPPVIERQLYVNQWTYTVSLEMETNAGGKFKKEIQLVVIDPSAVISTDKTAWYVGDEFQMRATTYFSSTRNVEYTWIVQSADWTDTKSLTTQVWQNFSFKFPKVGDYLITLISKSPNGSEDRDSKVISIDSHEPFINLENPIPLSGEKPNIFIFDASRSLDPDTNSAKNLEFRWTIDGNPVALDNTEKDGAIGKYRFNEKWQHTVSLTVINAYGKSKTLDRTFIVNSTLSINLNIVPRAAPIGTLVNFQAIAPRATFFEWNLGDGSPPVNGQMDSIVHTYKKTGIYSITLSVKNADGSETNFIERKVYVTDTNNPFALIEVGNASNTVIDDPSACGEGGAYIVNRSEWATIDGSNSINIDGNSDNLTYTWKYLDRIKTGPTLSEKFTELWCFPIELTVKSMRNGASHSSKRSIQIKNIEPKITAISTKIDQNKKDSQKILINVTADGARDADGVIISYIWYYKTESDPEPQNIKITQNASTTFIVPNITEKYTFWVILEDNDGARVNSEDILKNQSPLIITNDNGNINMPLISLAIPKTQVLAGETVDFVVSAKTIVGTDITKKSQYQWDFNGDGKIDRKTDEARTSYVYQNTGNYTAKVKVTYNGTSNTKYQNIVVKNELKAQIHGYKTNDSLYLINTSKGIYDSSLWQIGDIQSDSLYSVSLPWDALSGSGGSKKILTVSAWWNESSSVEITSWDIEDISTTYSGGIYVQSFPQIVANQIHIHSRWDKVLLSMFGNSGGTVFAIDTNTKIDSDTNGTPDDDIDNKDYPSYTDGSVFPIETSDLKVHSQRVRLTVLKNGTILGYREIDLIADYIADTSDESIHNLTSTGSESFSEKDKENLARFQGKIRSLTSDDRIILTQDYNILIENWDDILERTKKLIDIQEEVNGTSGISAADKKELSWIIDSILVGNANATDEVTVATQVIASLIPQNNPNRASIIEKLESIKSHPSNLKDNKALGSEILSLIKNDASIEDKYKLLIRSQLQVIVNGGQASTPPPDATLSGESSENSGILDFVRGTVKVFGMILVVIMVIILIGFILYRFTRKNTDIGFQDFLIDSIFHTKSNERTPPITKTPIGESTPLIIPQETPVKNDPLSVIAEFRQSPVDPMSSFSQNMVPEISSVNQLQDLSTPSQLGEWSASIPDWLRPQSTTQQDNNTTTENTGTSTDTGTPSPLPETMLGENTVPLLLNEVIPGMSSQNSDLTEKWAQSKKELFATDDENIPDWLKGMESIDSEHSAPMPETHQKELSSLSNIDAEKNKIEESKNPSSLPIWASASSSNSAPLPDWLVDSVGPEPQTEKKEVGKKRIPSKRKKDQLAVRKNDATTSTPHTSPPPEADGDLPDWLK